ncbi:hypothetical protein [Cohnella sp.]|uniref:hypothetical protein n=1 Tax=Cohnella sp. TaxID=1883426 RepID=UPI003561BB68
MIKFELREKYDAQDARFSEIRTRYEQKVKDAGTRLADLKAEQEALLRQEFSTGKDLSADKERIRASIEEAVRALTSAEAESRQANDYARTASGEGRISVRDLTKEWNGPYRDQVREKELRPIADRMAAAREAYLNSVLDYYDLIDDYSDLYRVVRENASQDRQADGYLYAREIATLIDLPRITDDDLSYTSTRRQLPVGVNRISSGGKSK